MEGTGRVGIFPDLAAARTKSVEAMNEIVGTREKFVQKIRAIIDPVLTPEERRQLDQLAILRDGYSRQASDLPTTDEGLKQHEHSMKERFGDLDRQVSELNVEIQSLEAQLVALEQYYRVSRSEQKIRPEDIEAPVRDMRAAVEDLRTMHDKLREQIADATHEASAAGSTGQAEREATQKLAGVLAQELAIERQAAARLSGPDRGQVDRVNDVLSRCDAVQTQLDAFDKRVDGQATVRLATVTRYLTAEKEELASASDKLGGILDESQDARRRPRPGHVHQGRRQVLRPGRPLRRRHHRRLLGAQGPEDPGGHQAHQPQEPRAEGPRRGLPQGARGRQVRRSK